MRWPWIAVAITAFVATPASASLPTFSVACAPTPAGSDMPCTVTRSGASQGAYVLFKTLDGTAKGGLDYVPVVQLLYFKAGTNALTVAVPTRANPGASGAVTLTAIVSGGLVASKVVASIIAAAPQVKAFDHVQATSACLNVNEDADATTPKTILSSVYTVIGSYGAKWPGPQVGGILLPEPVDQKKWGRGPTTVWVPWSCLKLASK